MHDLMGFCLQNLFLSESLLLCRISELIETALKSYVTRNADVKYERKLPLSGMKLTPKFKVLWQTDGQMN